MEEFESNECLEPTIKLKEEEEWKLDVKGIRFRIFIYLLFSQNLDFEFFRYEISFGMKIFPFRSAKLSFFALNYFGISKFDMIQHNLLLNHKIDVLILRHCIKSAGLFIFF